MMRSHDSAVDSLRRDNPQSGPIVDLRQYTLYPGTRDRFIELFDAEFVESQEAVGTRAIGQFRDLGDPNRFVWLKGHADMAARERALTAYYNAPSPAWAAHGDTARSMFIDTSDVLLLRPARPNSGFALKAPQDRPPIGSEAPDSVIVATIHHFHASGEAAFLDFYDDAVVPAHREAGARILGVFATERSPNNFPVLPIREDEDVLVAFAGFDDLDAYHEYLAALGANRVWRKELYPKLTHRLLMPPQTLRLAPTPRSQLR